MKVFERLSILFGCGEMLGRTERKTKVDAFVASRQKPRHMYSNVPSVLTRMRLDRNAETERNKIKARKMGV